MRIKVNKPLLITKLGQDKLVNLSELITLCSDSRIIEHDDIFMAFNGEHFLGHNFIEEAFSKGASLAIVSDRFKHKFTDHHKIIWVADTIKWLGELASLHLQQYDLCSIAITGSNGKTTTKEMTKALLMAALGKDLVFASDGNQNNHIGVAMNALAIKPHHKVAIFEMGMNHQGELSYLCDIIKPHIGLITNIGRAHEGNFIDGIDGVSKAKGELFMSIAHNHGIAIVNEDDFRALHQANKYNITKRVSFGFSPHADIVIKDCQLQSHHGQTITLARGQENFTFMLPLLGKHQALNAASALAIVLSLNLSLHQAIDGFTNFYHHKGRFFIYHHQGYTVIDDGYNANPDSMYASIEASKAFFNQRRIAVIGAMGELGDKSEKYHNELGQILAHNFDYLYFCGRECKWAITAALKEGFRVDHIYYEEESKALIEPLKSMLKDDDLVFIKGSLSANMKVITNAIIS